MNSRLNGKKQTPPKVTVAVLDSGLCESHARIKGLRIVKRVTVTENGIGDNTWDQWGHGTACVYVMRQTLEEHLRDGGCGLIIVKIFDKGMVVKERVLIEALKWCIQEEADVINVSLGLATYEPSDSLIDVCREAYEKGIIIVAAAHNEGKECYPAYLPFVFGVAGGVVRGRREFGLLENSPIEFIGRGTKQRVAWSDEGYVFDGSTSYAAAQLTGIVCNVRHKHPNWSPEKVRDYLFKIGKKNIRTTGQSFNNLTSSIGRHISLSADKVEEITNEYFDPTRKFRWIKNIGIYPYSNKEMQALKHFIKLCPFQVQEILDYPKSVVDNRLLRLGHFQFKKKWAVEEISSCLDTLVVGFPYETPFETNHLFFNKLLKYSIERELNFFCFSEGIANQISNKIIKRKKKGIIYAPKIDQKDADAIKSLQSLGKIKKPVFAIIGTNTRQGKFTSQLRIKQIMEEEGYKIGWLSTEPQGELLGANFSFPYGFGSSMKISLDEWTTVLYCSIKGIEVASNADLILAGHQGGLLPHTRTEFLKERLRGLMFLSGVQPDAVACVINPEDPLDFVKNIVEVVRNLFRIPVLFLILNPEKRTPSRLKNGGTYLRIDRLDEEEWATHANTFKEKLNLPVVNVLKENHRPIILSSIENYFGTET